MTENGGYSSSISRVQSKSPSDWDWAPLKYLCEISAEYGLNISSSEYTEEGVRFVRTTDIGPSGELSNEGIYLKPECCEDYLLEDGDLLLTRSGATVGKSYRYKQDDGPCAFASYLVRFRLREEMDSKFVSYYLRSKPFKDYVKAESTEATITNVSGSKFANMYVPKPEKEVQKETSKYLDEYTDKIDSVIKKKECLLELLEEKKEASIVHAVTKGLNSDAEMAESGIRPFGKIPSDWSITRLKFVSDVIDCKHRTAEYVTDGIPIVRPSDIEPGRLSLNGAKETTLDEYQDLIEGRRNPQIDDIIYSRNASLGAAALVDTDEEFCVGQDLCIIRPKIDGTFLHYLLNSVAVTGQVEEIMVGATFNRINVSKIKDLWITYPPMKDQKTIANHLESVTHGIDEHKNQIRQGIELLEEKRQALITKAVTGQIDLSGWDSQESQRPTV